MFQDNSDDDDVHPGPSRTRKRVVSESDSDADSDFGEAFEVPKLNFTKPTLTIQEAFEMQSREQYESEERDGSESESEDGEETRSSGSHSPKAKRRRIKPTSHFRKKNKRATDEQMHYKVEKLNSNCDSFDFKVLKNVDKESGPRTVSTGDRDIEARTVSFSDVEVTCSCPDFVRRIQTLNQNEVCKHICLIMGKCEQSPEKFYNGQRYFTREEKVVVFSLLATFNPTKVLGQSSEHAKKTKSAAKRKTKKAVLTPPRVKPIHKKGPFSDFKTALKNAPPPTWFLEVYGTGGYPRCRSCKERINHGDICLRADVAGAYKNPQTNSYMLRETTLRYCGNSSCCEGISPYDERVTNIGNFDPANVIIGNLTPEDVEIAKKLLPAINY